MAAPRDIALDGPAATGRLATALAGVSRAGDVIALDGPLGVGKTLFARAFITALGGAEDVPSPTFTLVQTYPLDRFDVWHFDLYRLEDWREAYELGIEDAFDTGVSLIEWPERLGPLLPDTRLLVALAMAGGDRRRAVLDAGGDWPARLDGMALGDG